MEELFQHSMDQFIMDTSEDNQFKAEPKIIMETMLSDITLLMNSEHKTDVKNKVMVMETREEATH
jgi:hypothetical protein